MAGCTSPARRNSRPTRLAWIEHSFPCWLRLGTCVLVLKYGEKMRQVVDNADVPLPSHRAQNSQGLQRSQSYEDDGESTIKRPSVSSGKVSDDARWCRREVVSHDSRVLIQAHGGFDIFLIVLILSFCRYLRRLSFIQRFPSLYGWSLSLFLPASLHMLSLSTLMLGLPLSLASGWS